MGLLVVARQYGSSRCRIGPGHSSRQARHRVLGRLLRSYLEAAEGDASFQLALMGSGDVEWEGIRQEKAEFAEIVSRIIERAAAAGAIRGDLSYPDFPLLARGVMSTMYFKSAGNSDWRRHLELTLDGVRGSGMKAT